MFIVFGWGKKYKALGYLGLGECGRCHKPAHHSVFKAYSYFSLFYIPIIRWDVRYVVSCTACGETGITEGDAYALRDGARGNLSAGAAEKLLKKLRGLLAAMQQQGGEITLEAFRGAAEPVLSEFIQKAPDKEPFIRSMFERFGGLVLLNELPPRFVAA